MVPTARFWHAGLTGHGFVSRSRFRHTASRISLPHFFWPPPPLFDAPTARPGVRTGRRPAAGRGQTCAGRLEQGVLCRGDGPERCNLHGISPTSPSGRTRNARKRKGRRPIWSTPWISWLPGTDSNRQP